MTTLSCIRRLLAAAPVAVSLLLVPALKATPLLTAAYEAQLEAWLGQGDLNLTNIFTKVNGDGKNAVDFHTAADGKGATFTLMDVYYSQHAVAYTLPRQIVGGYNPQSWYSSGGFNITLPDSERTAFIFNLSNGDLQRQKLTAQEITDSGYYQTQNSSSYGPSFGFQDLHADYWLETGSTTVNAYGTSPSGGFGNAITYGASNGETHSDGFYITRIEVYTFTASSSVPDTAGTLGLLGGALLVLAAFRRRVA